MMIVPETLSHCRPQKTLNISGLLKVWLAYAIQPKIVLGSENAWLARSCKTAEYQGVNEGTVGNGRAYRLSIFALILNVD